jgi:hypothetical protein
MKVLAYLINNIHDITTADGIPRNERLNSLKEIFVLIKLKFDSEQKRDNFIEYRMVKLQNFSISFKKNTRIQ